jgi:hypothetical protein
MKSSSKKTLSIKPPLSELLWRKIKATVSNFFRPSLKLDPVFELMLRLNVLESKMAKLERQLNELEDHPPFSSY